MRALIAALAFSAGLCAAGAEEPELQDVAVMPGDTLWKISQTYLKDPTKWPEILKHNKFPTSDPSVILPGSTIKVPKHLIKEDLRSAQIVHIAKTVHTRANGKTDWNPAKLHQGLEHGDSLRTYDQSWARVQFLAGGSLTVAPNSMAILKAPRKDDHDLMLRNGGVLATEARVQTPSALIVPRTRQTTFKAQVRDDQSTKVEVIKGAADVMGNGVTVLIREGYSTEVHIGKAPSDPEKMLDLAKLQQDIPALMAPVVKASTAAVQKNARETRVAAESLKKVLNLKRLSIGVPVAAFRLQVSGSQTFDEVVFDKIYDVDDDMDLKGAGLPAGAYWVRAAAIDLLGAQGKFEPPEAYNLK